MSGTLPGMGQAKGKVARTKSVPEPIARAFRDQLRAYVDEHHDGNQTAAAKALGMTQGHLSALMRGDRKVGLTVLLDLRAKTGRTIDEWLGLGAGITESTLRAIVRDEMGKP